MGSLGFEEMIVIAIVAIILYGRDLPSVARKVGRWYSNLRRQLGDIKDELKRHIPDEEIEEIKSAAENPVKAFTETAATPDPDPTPPAPPVEPAPPPEPGPSAGLPGPDPSDPEYRPDAAKAFDPTRPPELPAEAGPGGNGNGGGAESGPTAPPAPETAEKQAPP
jgi:sec-independent protein translocase protein TatA